MQRPDNKTTRNALEDQWAVVLVHYEDEPDLAFILAQNFQVMNRARDRTIGDGTGRPVIEDAIEALSGFGVSQVGREFFDLAVKGILRPALI